MNTAPASSSSSSSTPIAVVFTGKSIETIWAQRGSASWRVTRSRARLCEYVVCTRNTKADWSDGPEAHGSAFMIGRVKDVVAAPTEENPERYLFEFSEYALLSLANGWTGDRYPVHYTTLEAFGIDPSKLTWLPMPEPDPHATPSAHDALALQPSIDPDDGMPHETEHDDGHDRPLTMAQAKHGLALTFGISPDAVEITIRG